MNSERILDNIPPQMKILSMVIPILMLCNLFSNWNIASLIKPHVIQRNVTYKWRQTISDSILQDILSQIFDVIQSDTVIQNQVH